MLRARFEMEGAKGEGGEEAVNKPEHSAFQELPLNENLGWHSYLC